MVRNFGSYGSLIMLDSKARNVVADCSASNTSPACKHVSRLHHQLVQPCRHSILQALSRRKGETGRTGHFEQFARQLDSHSLLRPAAAHRPNPPESVQSCPIPLECIMSRAACSLKVRVMLLLLLEQLPLLLLLLLQVSLGGRFE
jgi:hypothetical protein